MIVEKAYAKINLGLEVLRKRDDNFHELAMVMTTISLADELYIEEVAKRGIYIESDQMKNIALEDNLIYKAAKLLIDKFNIEKGVKFKVIKNIPAEAGLGGGSADAAATLRGHNQLWKLGLSLDELADLGSTLGSDIPFCVYNKTAKVTGRGEIIEFIDEVPYFNLILAIPQFTAKTKDVFNSFKVHRRNRGKIDRLINGIKSRDIDKISDNFFNDLEYSYFFNDIQNIKRNFITAGAKNAVLTGSGTCVYALCLNEKDAIRVNNKFLQTNRNCTTIFAQTRSSIRYKFSGEARTQIKYKTIDQTRTKAYGYVPLIYQAIGDEYIEILSPISNYNEVFIEKINYKISEVYINEYLEDTPLTKLLEQLVDKLEYGLRVKIKEHRFSDFNIISPENYLSTIIIALSKMGEDRDNLYSYFNNKVQAYQKETTFLYDSRADKVEYLNNIPFGHILITDLNLKNQNKIKYTVQIDKAKEIEEVKEGLEEQNFYKITNSLHNSIEKFEQPNIRLSSLINLEKVRRDCFKYGAQGFILSTDAKKIISFARNEKQIKKVAEILRNFYNLRKSLFSTLKSSNSHKSSISKVLKEVELEVITEDVITDEIQVDQEQRLELFKALFEEKEVIQDYSNLEIDHSNPFESESTTPSIRREPQTQKFKERKEKERSYVDVEEILHIHSGGSLFKRFDFVDIAEYFEKYFNNKKIELKIDEERVEVIFKVEHLPHLLGMYKINPEIKGRVGFNLLKSGSFSYDKLKRSDDKKTFNYIIRRTQSLVLIFNDFYHGRDRDLLVYDKDIIAKMDSKMRDKLLFGITKGVADNQFHTRNVVGVGHEGGSNASFFLTTFVWEAQASLGKKDGHQVEIIK